MGNAASSMEMSPAKEIKTQPTASSPLPPKQPAPPKLPMPNAEELEERFGHVLVSLSEAFLNLYLLPRQKPIFNFTFLSPSSF